jgi:hypothetical protein
MRRWASYSALTLFLAVLLGASIRLRYVLTADFPLNDGGLFYTMSQNIGDNHYQLPVFTTYNRLNIPFGYSPLPFYLAAGLSDMLGADLMDVVRILPSLFSILTIPVFWLLSRELLENKLQVGLSVLIFAVLPRSYEWLIMGGGLTRAPGMFFALLTMWQITLLYKHGSRQQIVFAALFGALTILSHPGMGWLMAFSCAVLFMFLGHSRRAFFQSVLVGFGALMVLSPWIMVVMDRHGVDVFIAAIHTSSPVPLWMATVMNLLFITGEPLISIFLLLGYLGAIANASQKKWLLPVWLIAILLLSSRSAPTDSSALMSMLAAVGIDKVLLPVLARGHKDISKQPIYRLPSSRITFGILAVYMLVTGFITVLPTLNAMPAADRQAMRWIAQNTPDNSQFLLLTSAHYWQADAVQEWFPSLALRHSLTTVQGNEWLPSDRFSDSQNEYKLLKRCQDEELACLETWEDETGQSYTHIYISKSGDEYPEAYFDAIEAQLRADSNYRVIYENSDVIIFRRLSN